MLRKLILDHCTLVLQMYLCYTMILTPVEQCFVMVLNPSDQLSPDELMLSKLAPKLDTTAGQQKGSDGQAKKGV